MKDVLYCAILSKIQKEIKENKDIFLKMDKIDKKYSNLKIEDEKLFEIIEYYKSKQVEKLNKKKYIFCNGNPYIVLNLAMIAIINNSNISINIDDEMLGFNTILLTIINKILKNNNMDFKISLFKEKEHLENIIFIDRINDYNLLKKKFDNVKFVPYQGIDVFLDGDEFGELFEKIYEHSLDMNITVDLFDEEGIETMLKYGEGKRKLILTDKKEIIEKYKGENIFINENPFKEEKIIFDDEMIKEILS